MRGGGGGVLALDEVQGEGARGLGFGRTVRGICSPECGFGRTIRGRRGLVVL